MTAFRIFIQHAKHLSNMKSRQIKPVNLVEGGKEEWETTDEYRAKVNKIIKDVTDKYSPTLLNENNWVKRLLIKVRLKVEIRKRIQELSSLKNLHAADTAML